MGSLIHISFHFFLQTVASPRVSEPLLFLFLLLLWSLLWSQGPENPRALGLGEARAACTEVPTWSPFLPTVSYQQGVLSATVLYEILLGKATLYAVLVSALVLMAMVGTGRDGAGRLEVTHDTQQLIARSIETLPGLEVAVGNEGVSLRWLRRQLAPLCGHSGRSMLGRRSCGHLKTQCVRSPTTCLVLGPPTASQSPPLLILGNPKNLFFCRSRERIPEASSGGGARSFQPVTESIRIFLRQRF